MTNRDLTYYPKYSITGNLAQTILANRVSFFFDLHGPSVQIDTACSSGLTALHLGCQSLLSGESDMAIICGTALHFDPTIFVTMSDFGMLSTDGRCRHFDAAGSGYVRGDGICAVILKRQRDAEGNNDTIRAIIRGTGANHDGTKEGITLPNPTAQADLVRRVYHDAGISPQDTGYFEAHGTGTKAGDPREAQGIGAVFAASRTEPLYVGSIKTNIGHLEGASGLAGVIKAMMSVEKGKILPNMHFNTPNPDIDFAGLKIKVPESVIDWAPTSGIRRASVNSFGFGGSNVHAVLENYVGPLAIEAPQDQPARAYLLPLSSHTENAGSLLQQSLSQYMRQNADTSARDLVFSYTNRRTVHGFRSFAVGRTLQELEKNTETLQPQATWKRAEASTRLGFIFTGQGAQWYAMGRQLIEEHPLFRQSLVECQNVLMTLPDAPTWSVLDELTKSETESRLSKSEFSQPLCTAVQIALVDLLASWGIRPAAVAGHSSGEIAAAYAAGSLSKRDTIICAYYRGLYMSKGLGGAAGRMMAVGLTEAEANAELADFQGKACIAAVNSPSSITLSGDEDAILAIKARLDERKAFARLLQVEQAFHSHHMIPLAPAFKDAVSGTPGFEAGEATVRMFSSVTGRDSSARPMDASYWADNMTGRVRFSDAVTGMVLDDQDNLAVDVIVELGPHPALKGPAKQTLKQLGIDIPYIGTLDRKVPAYESLVACAGNLFTLGYNVDINAVNSDASVSESGEVAYQQHGRRLKDLPTYSWDHKSYWSETRTSKSFRHRALRTPLLGALVPGSPFSHPRWHNYLRLSELPWLADYAVDGSVVLPASAFLTMAIEALLQMPSAQGKEIQFKDVTIPAALPIPDTDRGVEVMLDLRPLDNTKDYAFTVYSFNDAGDSSINCTGNISTTDEASVSTAAEYDLDQALSKTNYRLTSDNFYAQLESVGLGYGSRFKVVQGWLESGKHLTVTQLNTAAVYQDHANDTYKIHPALLDGMTQGIFLAIQSSLEDALQDAYVVTSFNQITISTELLDLDAPQEYWTVSNKIEANQRTSRGSVSVHASTGKELARFEGIQLASLGRARDDKDPYRLFRTAWKPAFDFLGVSGNDADDLSADDVVAIFRHSHPSGTVLDTDAEDDSNVYDLIVAKSVVNQNTLSKNLKPCGFVLSQTNEDLDNMTKVFSSKQCSLWQTSQPRLETRLDVLIDNDSSVEIQQLVAKISKESDVGSVTVLNLDTATDATFAQVGNHVVVVSEYNSTNGSTKENDQLIKQRKDRIQSLVDHQERKLTCLHYHASTVALRPSPEPLSTTASLLFSIGGHRVTNVQMNAACEAKIGSILSLVSSGPAGENFSIKDGQVLVARIITDTTPAATPMAAFNGEALKLEESSSSYAIQEDTQSALAGTLRVNVVESCLVRAGPTACVAVVNEVGATGKFKQGDNVLVLAENGEAHNSRLRVQEANAFSIPASLNSTVSHIAVPLLQAIYAINNVAHIQKEHSFVVYGASTHLGMIAISLIRAAGAGVVAVVDDLAQRQLVAERLVLSLKSIIQPSELTLLTNFDKRFFINCTDGPVNSAVADAVSEAHFVSFNASDNAVENTTQTRVDIMKLLMNKPAVIKNLVSTMVTVASEPGLLPDLGTPRIPYSKVAEAAERFRTDAQLESIQLFDNGEPVPLQRTAAIAKVQLDPSKVYIMAGGFGSFAWPVASWLLQAGARAVSFLQSVDETHPAAIADVIKWLQIRGVDAQITTDISKLSQVDGVFCGPRSISSKTLQAVEEIEKNNSLSMFVCISSAASQFGRAGESISTTFYNKLVRWRRAHRLPASSVCIGLAQDAGYGSAEQASEAALKELGLPALPSQALFSHLSHGALSQYPDGDDCEVDDDHSFSGLQLETKHQFWNTLPLMSVLNQELGQDDSSAAGAAKSLSVLMREAKDPEEKLSALAEAFVEKMSVSLSIAAQDIHIGLPLSAYGMDSLVAVDFRTWFSKELRVNLALFEILGSSTTKHMLQHVCDLFTEQQDKAQTPSEAETATKAEKPDAADDENRIVLKPIPDQIPLSSFQRRMWFMDSMMESPGGLTCGFTLSIQGKPDLALLNDALHKLGRRNAIFRTRYIDGDEYAQQEVLEEVVGDVEFQDISADANAESSVQDHMDALLKRPMDLEKGEVIHTVLLKTGEESYAWLVATHHITIDGSSRQSMMEQIVTCYNDAVHNENNTSNVPPLSYVDFTLWHEDMINSDAVKQDLGWWKNVLAGANGTSDLLPFAQHTRAEKASDQRRVIRSKLSTATLKRMKRVCGSVNATPFHFILAALRSFVFRYTNQEDLTLLVIAGERPHSAFERILGFFVNVIPLRWQGTFDESFEATLLKARELAVESMAHSQAPFDEIVDQLDLERNPQHFPLGQIALNYQMYAKSPRYSTEHFDIVDVHVTDVPTSSELQFEILEHQDAGLGFTLDYDSYLYSDSDMDRFLDNFMVFIESAVQDFRQPVEEIAMCGSLEMEVLRNSCWTEKITENSWMHMTLWDRYDQLASQNGAAIAITTSDGRSITRAALRSRAIELAQVLHSAGVVKGDRIGVVSYASTDVIASMLAIARLRCTFVPMDPNNAQGRIEYMIENTSAAVVLHGSELDQLIANLSASTKAKFISYETATVSSISEIALPAVTNASPDDVCYIVYTSGSTGKPKGVMVSHENTQAMLVGRETALSLGSSDVFLSHTSMSFDISMAQTWGSLTSGATMALATREARSDVEQLVEFIRTAQVTMIYFTPTQLAMIVENCLEELGRCTKLRSVSMIGEHLPPRLVKAVYDLKIDGLIFYNEYGPSESTSQNTYYKVPYPEPNQLTVDIGKPLPNSSTYVVNSRLRPVPVGVFGELCIGGPQVSLGYLGRASTAFVPNPLAGSLFTQSNWTRLYRTGDMARFRPTGVLDLKGRISGDKQVKLRGHRIDLEEIETEIHRLSRSDAALSAITSVVVLARTLDKEHGNMTDDRQLVAFIALRSPQSSDKLHEMAAHLNEQLSNSLNKYMLPSCYQPMDAIPTMVSGKIDRVGLTNMKLQPIFHSKSKTTTTVAAPVVEQVQASAPADGPVEVIKQLFATVLKLPADKTIQSADNFFDLGGQSVLALRLQKSLKKEFSVPVKLVDIFRNPTPGGLAVALKLTTTTNATAAASIAAGSAARPLVEIDYDAEATLPNEPKYQAKNAVGTGLASSTRNGVLVVGADGYIGYYLLKYLLALQPNSRIYLLATADRFNLGDLFAAFLKNKLFDESVTQVDLLSRVEIVEGNVGEAKFGLGDAGFDALAQNIHAIYHTGGFVSLLATYSDLRARNVQSVLNMIELAAACKAEGATSLHYISTWSIVHVQTWQTTTIQQDSVWLDEKSVDTFRPPTSNDHGYFKTRWVAEMLLEQASQRGLPSIIYRCPAHTAPIGSLSATPSDNFTINLYLSMVRTGLILKTAERPDGLESDVGMLPIDYIADTLVRLAATPEVQKPGQAEALRLHITNPRSVPYSAMPGLVAELRDDGAQGKLLDLAPWFEQLTAASSEQANLEFAMYKEYLDKGHIMFTVDDSKTRPLLDKLDAEGDARRVKCPAVDAEYFRSMMLQAKLFGAAS